ncbi:MAG TPA: hypothetical protein VGB45_16290 [Abditibacterium sp.]|jgi:hypothetical protein
MIFAFLFFCLAIVWALFWLASLGGFLWSWWRKTPEEARSAKKTFLWLSWVGILTTVLVLYLMFPSPTRIYHNAFNENPSPDVSNLQGTSETGYDFQEVELKFQADLTTIQRMAKIQNLRLITNPSDPWRANEEKWGSPEVRKRSLLYAVGERSGSFAREDVSLRYDPQTRKAVYRFHGID